MAHARINKHLTSQQSKTIQHSSKFSLMLSRLRNSTDMPQESKEYGFYAKKLKLLTSLDDSADLINDMLNKLPPLFPNNAILNSLIHKAGHAQRMDYVYTLYDIAKRKGTVDAYTYSNLIYAISKNRFPDFEEAKKWLELAKEEKKADAVTYNNTLTVLNRVYPINVDEAVRLLNEAINSQHFDEYTFSITIAILAKCVKPDVNLALKLLDLAKIKKVAGVSVYISTMNAIIKSENPDLNKAYELFKEYYDTEEKRNAAFYTCILPVIEKRPDALQIIDQILQDAKKEGNVDERLYNHILNIHLQNVHSNIQTIAALIKEAHQLHLTVSLSENILLMISESPELDADTIILLLRSIQSFSLMRVDLYCDLIQRISTHPNAVPMALKVLEDSKEDPDVRIFNAVLSVLTLHKHNALTHGELLIKEAEDRGIANAITYTTFINIIAKSDNPSQRLAAHWLERAIHRGKANTSTYIMTFLVMAKSESPSISRLQKFLTTASAEVTQQIEFYNNALSVIAHSHKPDKQLAFQILNLTQERKIADVITYTNVILVIGAIKSSTKVTEAFALLQRAKDNQVQLDVGIYNCVLDILAREEPSNTLLGNHLIKEGIWKSDIKFIEYTKSIDLHELSYGSTYFFLKFQFSNLHQFSKEINFTLIYGKGLHSRSSEPVHPVKKAVLDFLREVENDKSMHLEYQQNPANSGEIDIKLQYKKVQEIHPFLNQTIDPTSMGAVDGLIHASANVISEVLQPYGIEKGRAKPLLYYGGVFSAKLAMQSSEMTDAESCLNTLCQAALETGQLWLINSTLSSILNVLSSHPSIYLNRYLPNHTWVSLGLFTKKIWDQDFSEAVKSFADEALVKTSIEAGVNKLESLVRRPRG